MQVIGLLSLVGNMAEPHEQDHIHFRYTKTKFWPNLDLIEHVRLEKRIMIK